MADAAALFSQHLDFDPAADFSAFLSIAPARWAVYLLTDADDRPVQLLCVKNLRASLQRRLGEAEPQQGPTRKIDYRQVVRRVHWRRVDSAFEADWHYLQAARALFPQSYRGMLGMQPAWFLHINPAAKFPRYVRTNDLADRPGLLLGPLQDKHAAQRLIEAVEDAFDLCRYFHILAQAPDASACAYKDMGKCPAPCDGSISLPQYHNLIDWSLRTLADPAPEIAQQQQRMADASAAQHYEIAAKIRAFIEALTKFSRPPWNHVRPLEQFQFVSLQRGPHARTAKAFWINGGAIEERDPLLTEKTDFEQLATDIAARREPAPHGLDLAGTEHVGLVARHLFAARGTGGIFLPASAVTSAQLAGSFRDTLRTKPAAPSPGEGLLKELGAP
jgi:excinuclease UvrABC nuclease subunit